MTNERTIDRIVNSTFEEIDAFSKLIIIFEIFNRASRSKYDFRGFFQIALIFPIFPENMFILFILHVRKL